MFEADLLQLQNAAENFQMTCVASLSAPCKHCKRVLAWFLFVGGFAARLSLLCTSCACYAIEIVQSSDCCGELSRLGAFRLQHRVVCCTWQIKIPKLSMRPTTRRLCKDETSNNVWTEAGDVQ